MMLPLLGAALIVLILLAVGAVLVIVVLLALLRALRRGAGGGGPGGGGPGGGGPGGTIPAIPDHLPGPDVAGYLAARLAGTPADGSAPAGSPPPAVPPARVVWVDHGDEVLVHLDSTATQIIGQSLLVSIDLECDQTGRTPLVTAFALPPDEAAGLVVATDEYPRGNGLLAARWGPAVQAASWSALLALAGDHAAERELAPRGLAVAGGQLRLIAGPPLKAG